MRVMLLSVLAVVVVGAAVLPPLLSHRSAHPDAHVPSPRWPGENSAEARRRVELDDRFRTVVDRNRSKVQVVDAVHRGELTLAEALVEFERLNAGSEPEYLRKCFPDASAAELSFRNLVLFLRPWMEDASHGPARAAEMRCMFRAQFPGREFDPLAIPVSRAGD